MKKQLPATCARRVLEVLCLASYLLGLLSIVTNGLELSVGGATLSIHSPGRPFILSIIFLVTRLWIDPRFRTRIREKTIRDRTAGGRQHPWTVTAGFLLLAAFLFFIFQARFTSDDYYYYDYLRSLFFDSDLSFLNERAIHHPSWIWITEGQLVQPTATGYVNNVFAAGASLLWLPFFLIGHGCAILIQVNGGKLFLDGYSASYLSLLTCGSIAYTFCGLILTYRMCRDLISEKWGFAAVLFIFFGSPLFYYTFHDPCFSHGMSFFTTALFINLWLRQRSRPDLWGAVLLGLAGGLMTLVRWQNLLFFTIPALDWLMLAGSELRDRRSMKKIVRATFHQLLCALFALIVFLPQMVIFKILSGSFFDPGSRVAHHLTSPKVLKVLFSPWHGLFSWSPVLLIAMVGVVALAFKKRRLGTPLLVALFLQVYINATVTDWWAGGGFGMRRMCATLPIFALGLTLLLKGFDFRRRRWVMICGCLAAVGWNCFLIIFHLSGRVFTTPEIHLAMFAPEFWPHYGQSILRIFRTAACSSPWAWSFLPLFVGVLIFPLRLISGEKRLTRSRTKTAITMVAVVGAALLTHHLWSAGHRDRTIEVLEIGDSEHFGKLIPFKIGSQAAYQGGYMEWRVTDEDPFHVFLRGTPSLPMVSIISHCESKTVLEKGRTLATVTILGTGGERIVFPLRRGFETDYSCAENSGLGGSLPAAALPVLQTNSEQCKQGAIRFGARFQLPAGLELGSFFFAGSANNADAALVLSGICFEDQMQGHTVGTMHYPATIHVPADHPTIQDGIDRAVPGDTVLVADGVYVGERNRNLDVRGKAISIVSEHGPASCIIDCQGQGRGFHFDSSEGRESQVQGFTIRGGNPDSGEGGGIYMLKASPTIKDCLIRGNHAETSGGGIFCSASSPLISGCRIEDNHAGTSGGGLLCSQSAPRISGTLFRNNSAESIGGAVFCLNSALPLIEDSRVEQNSAGEQGGGLGCTGRSAPILRNTLFLTNRAPRGGAAYGSRSSLSIISCTFSENRAGRGGALFFTSGSSLSIVSSILYGDTAEQGAEILIGGSGAANRLAISYSDLEGGRQAVALSPNDHLDWGPGMIDASPLFSRCSLGDHFLGQKSCGQLADSPCLNGGDPTGERIEGTTRSDLVLDHGLPDLGYHYPLRPRLVLSPGPGKNNPPLIQVLSPAGRSLGEFIARGGAQYGARVSCGDINGDFADEILVGAGAGPFCPPRVQGFRMDGSALAGVDFLAYSTRKQGVNVAAGDLDGDGAAEIITGPGPGSAFGPQVKVFHYGSDHRIRLLNGNGFSAFNYQGWGVNVAAGDLDGDGFAEIVTGCGPGPTHEPGVRGWNVDGDSVSAMPGLTFTAYDTREYGVVVCCGDLDGDGIDEIITAPGPNERLGSHIRGWKYDGSTVTPLPGFNFFAWRFPRFNCGATLHSGTDLDGDGRAELVVGTGPAPETESLVNIYSYIGTTVILRSSLGDFARGMTHGVNVAAGMENVIAGDERYVTSRGQ